MECTYKTLAIFSLGSNENPSICVNLEKAVTLTWQNLLQESVPNLVAVTTFCLCWILKPILFTLAVSLPGSSESSTQKNEVWFGNDHKTSNAMQEQPFLSKQGLSKGTWPYGTLSYKSQQDDFNGYKMMIKFQTGCCGKQLASKPNIQNFIYDLSSCGRNWTNCFSFRN